MTGDRPGTFGFSASAAQTVDVKEEAPRGDAASLPSADWEAQAESPAEAARTVALIIDRATGVQYEEGGLENALAYLHKTLGAVIPVDRVLYSCNSRGETRSEELAWTGGADTDDSRLPPFSVQWPRSMSHVGLAGGGEGVIVDNSSQGGSTRVLMRSHHARYRSILTVLLHREAGRGYYIAVMSEKPDAYSPADAELLHASSRSLAECLRRAHARGQTLQEEDVEVPFPGNSSVMLLRRCKCLAEVTAHAEKVARTDSTVLISGETGTGKEVLADFIHELSTRATEPLVKVNCGGIPETLIESEFFGHEKGAFTGAVTSHSGYFEQANGGTLFLDEVGDLSLQAQVRLLRVLERREIQRLGGTRRKPVNVRLIAATNRDLESMVKRGEFREDLWFRLHVFPLHLPPLRWRQEDMPVLVRHFIERTARALRVSELPVPRAEEMTRLTRYSWPGNLRELAHVVERAMILALEPDGRCGPLHFSLPRQEATSLRQRYRHAPPEKLPTLQELTTAYLEFVQERTEGRIAGPGGAADILGMPPNSLRSKLRQLGLYSPGRRGRPSRREPAVSPDPADRS